MRERGGPTWNCSSATAVELFEFPFSPSSLVGATQ